MIESNKTLESIKTPEKKEATVVLVLTPDGKKVTSKISLEGGSTEEMNLSQVLSARGINNLHDIDGSHIAINGAPASLTDARFIKAGDNIEVQCTKPIPWLIVQE